MSTADQLAKFRTMTPAQRKAASVLLPVFFWGSLPWVYVTEFWSEFKSCCWHTRQEGRIVKEEYRAFRKSLKELR